MTEKGSPNTRARRTRSSPSVPHSPPTCKPLGLLGLIAMVVAALGCSASAQQSVVPAAGEFPAGCLTHPKNTDPEVTPPRLTHRVDPKVARTDPSPVYVCLDATVATDGTLADLKVLKSGGGAMDTAALEAARQWRYSPATRHGVPIALPVNIVMTMTSR